MANNSPTIVAASLSDDQLKKSIDSLVSHVDEAMKKMVQSTNTAVGEMEAKLKSLGNIKIDTGGSADGGATKRTKAQNEETAAIKESTQAYKDKKMALDQMASSQQVAIRSANPSGIRNADTLQTMNIQLDLLRERLREARQQYSSFIALAAHATTTGDKGLFQYATDGVHRYEQEVRSLIPQIRGLQDGIQQMGNVLAPQGHTIQNYINSLQKANPELAQLNEQFKSGQSLLQQQKSSFVQNAQAQHNSANATNQTRQSLDALNAAVAQNTRKEDERRIAIIRSGQAAQESLARIKQNAQIELAENTGKPISGLKELTAAIREMERAYWDMSSYGKESPIGQSLKADIEYARKLKTAIEAYNRTLGGFSVIGNKDGVNNTLGSYSELSMLLKTLADDYKKLGREERNAAKGNDLADKIQRLGRATQKIQQQMNRPISFAAAMKGDEKTLDDIAYKMQRLRSYRQGIDLTKPNAANEIKQVDEALAKLQKDADKWMNKSQQMIKNNTALGRSWNYMKNRLAFYFTVGAGTQFIKNLIEVRSQYEMNERALGILINSAERGTQIFNELSQMALVSPYTLIELSSAAKQLTAYDVAAKDVVDTTRRLADMAAAVGIPIERLTYALGQIKAYGYLNSRDARMFANAGIPLVKQLSDYYTELEGKMVSTADVYDRMKKKAIDYNSVMAVVTKMTDEGGKFFDFQAKMADTLKVRLANLTLAWNNMLNDMGKETQGVLTWSIGALRDLFLQWKNLYGALNEVALVFGVAKALQFLGVCAHAAGIGFGSLNKYMTLNSLLGTRLATTVRTLGNAFMSLVRSPLAWFTMAALLVTEIGDAFFNADRATKEFNKSLREGAKTTYEDLKKFAEQYKNVRDSLYTTQKTAIGNIYDPSTGKAAATAYANQTVGQDISASEAKKVWEAMREQIELSSHASDEYISKLLSIENVSERLRQGFQILDDIQTVSAALKEIGEDGIKVTQSWAAWWNAWQGADGLIDNVKDLQKEIQRLQDAGQDPNDKFTKVIDKDYATALERFRKDLKVTTDSVIDFINLNGWSGDTGKIDEVFKQVTDRLATQGNLDPQTAFTLQREVEVARAKAAKEALEIRIADEKKALATASDEISKQQIQKNLETLEQQKRDFDKFNGENRAYWNDFTKYIKERHISELTAAYNSMTDHGKKAMDFQSEEWQKHVHDWANRYEKSHNLATDSVFNRLRNWINDANTWSVFIKMTISTEDGKSVYKQLEEYDKAADDAWKTMQRLDKRISQLRKKGAKEVEGAETGVVDLSRVSQDDRELTEALKERTQAQKDYNDAVEKGGESKKENAAARKAAKQAESELAKALKDELSTIEKVRSIYKDLTKEGMSHANAVERATRGWDETVNAINRVLQKNGLQKLDLSKFAGIENPRELVNMLQSQLNTLLKRGAKPAEIKELQTKVNTLEVDADKYDLTKITKGLNSELDRLKDEYELAVSLDADPELGSIFADYMGIDLNELPKNAEEAAKKAQQYIDKILRENKSKEKIDITSLMGKDAFDKWIKSSGHSMEDNIVKVVDNYRQALHKMQVDESKKQMQEWDKLLEKYAEYEYKVTQIQKEAERERETARKKGASQEILDAINNREKQELARVSFEEFQKSPEWIVATGDLANMSKSAIGMLIEQLEKYKRSAKNLSPKQIKQLNSALSKLYKEQRKNNPFKAISNMLDEAKERMATFDEDINKTQKEIDNLTTKKKESIVEGIADEETDNKLKKAIERLKELKKAREETGKVDASSWVSSINETISAVQSAIGVFDDLAKAIGGVESSDLDKVFSVIDKAGQGAAIGAQIGGGYGAIIGAVAGAATELISIFAGAENERITAKVEESERAVKRLELAYIDLEHAVQQAYGMATIGANMAAKANKELQLVELKRQLALERSRDSKHRDEDKIIDLQKQIKELEYDIADTVDSIVNDLLGISSVGDAMENMMDAFVEALRSGEDAMAKFDESVDEMIANMVKKMYVTKILQPWFEEQWNKMQEQINQRAGDVPEKIAKMQSKTSIAKSADTTDNNSLVEALRALGMSDDQIHRLNWYNEFGKYDFGFGRNARLKAAYEKMLKEAEQKEAELQKELTTATMPTTDDIRQYAELLRSGQPIMEENMQEVANFLRELGLMKDDSNKNLSALQQGISQISESTAESLEAYMNGVSQQVYLHSDLLTQIRDAVVGMDMDIQVATQAQMLLQLQQSYAVQMAIQGILEGWNNPSGQAVRVELVS